MDSNRNRKRARIDSPTGNSRGGKSGSSQPNVRKRQAVGQSGNSTSRQHEFDHSDSENHGGVESLKNELREKRKDLRDANQKLFESESARLYNFQLYQGESAKVESLQTFVDQKNEEIRQKDLQLARKDQQISELRENGESLLLQQQTLIKDALNEELNCAFCIHQAIEAVSLECGHIFCHRCISLQFERSIQNRKCPLCLHECVQTTFTTAVVLRGLQARLLSCTDAQSQAEYAAAVEERQNDVSPISIPRRLQTAICTGRGATNGSRNTRGNAAYRRPYRHW